MSLLSTIGADFKKVFSWIGNPKTQSTITAIETTGEAVAAAIDPGLAGLFPLINTWTQEIFKMEALATAAGSQTGTGAQKSAAVLSSVTPAVLAYAQQAGLSAPTAAQIATVNTALVTVLNTLGAPAA